SVRVCQDRLPRLVVRVGGPRLLPRSAHARELREADLPPAPQLVVGRAGGARRHAPGRRRPRPGRAAVLPPAARLAGRRAGRGALLQQRRRGDADVGGRGGAGRAGRGRRLRARRGDAVAQHELTSPGPAVRIAASQWRAPQDAARRVAAAGLLDVGVAQVECALLDAHGQRAGDEALVSVEVEGGELLGIENGDLADTTPYTETSRSTHDGRLVVYVRCDGPAQVRLSAPGLPPATVECVP